MKPKWWGNGPWAIRLVENEVDINRLNLVLSGSGYRCKEFVADDDANFWRFENMRSYGGDQFPLEGDYLVRDSSGVHFLEPRVYIDRYEEIEVKEA